MISGRAAYAVLAAFLMAAVLLLAAPAWSQDKKDPDRAGDAARKGLEREKGKASERAGEATTDKGSKRARSEASRKDSARSRDATAKESSKRDKNNASNKKSNSKSSNEDPVDGQEVTVQKDEPIRGVVDAGDVLMIPGKNYDVSNGASVTIKDQSSHKATFDNQNADITDTNNGDVKIAVDDDTDLVATDKLRVVKADGIRANRFGPRRGARAGSDACRQNVDVGSLQYQPIEQICIIERGRGNNPFPPFFDDFEDFELFEDFEEDLEELLEEDDEEVVVRFEPDGVVADTSAVGKLPFTGGPGFTSVVAAIAALTLLGIGAGVVLLRLGRSDD